MIISSKAGMQHTPVPRHAMQTIPNRFLTLGLALLGLFAACAQIHAQTVTSLLTMTNTSWHYYQNTNQPPVQGSIPWYQTNYSDTAWPQGPGVFGFETERVIPGAEIRTPLNLTQPGASAQTITYYFRTHFTYSLNTPGVEMWFTNFYDDGFVVYLNGGELYRIGVGTGQTYGTLATGHEATGFDYTSITNSPL